MTEKDNDRRLYECENGHVYSVPSNHCVFCKHCTDLFYDYTNGPYMFFCELEKNYKDCDGDFEYDGYTFDAKDFLKRKNEQIETCKKIYDLIGKENCSKEFYDVMKRLSNMIDLA